tara:strand:- start:4275 stop:4427 length:153 start_codon:yes stop_codon:yes gene_type:complete
LVVGFLAAGFGAGLAAGFFAAGFLVVLVAIFPPLEKLIFTKFIPNFRICL